MIDIKLFINIFNEWARFMLTHIVSYMGCQNEVIYWSDFDIYNYCNINGDTYEHCCSKKGIL